MKLLIEGKNASIIALNLPHLKKQLEEGYKEGYGIDINWWFE